MKDLLTWRAKACRARACRAQPALWLLALAIGISDPRDALAQQPAPPQPPAQQPPAPQPPAPQTQTQQQPPQPPAYPQSPAWANLPKMVLERQFSGPLQDTVIQRWRDPVDGATCFLYLPITAPHSPITASGFVQYGANTIGSISCIPGTAVAASRPAAAPPAPPAPQAPRKQP